MTKVKVGDRVRMIKKCDNARVGEEGIVIALLEQGRAHDILVMFDSKDSAKHSGRTEGNSALKERIKPFPKIEERADRCQFVDFDDVEKVFRKTCKLIITMDGNKVTAKLVEGKFTVATGVAKCSPSDTFDFLVGAQLAMHRCIAGQTDKPLVIDMEAAKAHGIKFNP